jgi:hypothetical protein
MATTAFDEALEKVRELVATFKAGETEYLSPNFQEAQARKDFIDKFWMALGWDVNHDRQKNPYEQESPVWGAVIGRRGRFSNSVDGTDKDFWANKCTDLDAKIDRLVYNLYGLTEEEIRIVEGAGS